LPSTAPHPADVRSLSLHDALPICRHRNVRLADAETVFGVDGLASLRHIGEVMQRLAHPHENHVGQPAAVLLAHETGHPVNLLKKDRKSTRLNSSHVKISYAVFCLK